MKTIEETARMLAEEHARNDTGLEAVYWSPADDEVHLVEVSSSLPDIGEVLPFRYASFPPDVPYPTVVILLGPGDWSQVLRSELELPSAFETKVPIFSRGS